VTDWLATCREAVADAQGVLVDLPTRAEREPVVGTGEGGDETTFVDAEVERVVLALLDDRLEDYTLVSEEIGEVVKGSGRPWLVLDPVDGSLNAKRGLPFACVSIAIASGPAPALSAFTTLRLSRTRSISPKRDSSRWNAA